MFRPVCASFTSGFCPADIREDGICPCRHPGAEYSTTSNWEEKREGARNEKEPETGTHTNITVCTSTWMYHMTSIPQHTGCFPVSQHARITRVSEAPSPGSICVLQQSPCLAQLQVTEGSLHYTNPVTWMTTPTDLRIQIRFLCCISCLSCMSWWLRNRACTWVCSSCMSDTRALMKVSFIYVFVYLTVSWQVWNVFRNIWNEFQLLSLTWVKVYSEHGQDLTSLQTHTALFKHEMVSDVPFVTTVIDA